MSYRVYYDDYLLYDPIMTDYKLINPTWETELSKVGKFTFTIPVTHPNFQFIELMKPLVKIYRDGVLKFKGRIYKIEEDFYGNKTCTCEDCMAFLYDILIAPFNFEGTAGEMFQHIIAWHNERASAEQQIIMGVTDATTEVDRWQQNYQNAYDTIIQHVVNYHQGYMRLRYDANENPVIDYLSTFSGLSTQHVTYGVNLQDHIIDKNAEDFATVVVPLGGQMNEIDPESTDVTRLTIKEVNGGIDYLVNEDMANVYGMNYAKPSKTTHDMVHNASTLMQKGYEDLAKATVYKNVVEVTMADLGMLEDVDSPDVGTNIIIDSAPHGGTVSYLLRRMEVDLSNPAMATITLGDEKESFLAKQQRTNQDLGDRIYHIETTYLTEAQRIASTTIENNTSIIQQAEGIILEALQNYVRTTDYETQMAQLSTALTVAQGNITATNTLVTEVQGDTNSRFNTIETYIRFDENGLTLGKNDSSDPSALPIKLRLANDKLYFFSGADDTSDVSTALAYFDSNGLSVKNVIATETLTIGDFYWQPEDNGSLSLVYKN